jgi:lysophospholipase L1-like esterase
MRERFGKERADGLIDYHWTRETEEYDPDYVNPTRWTVDFDACGTVPSPGDLRWDIDGQPLSQTTCSFSHDFTELKSYVVSLIVTTPDGQANSARASVTLRDILIVSIGDSFASGEGNPDKTRADPGGVKWIDDRCHRSAWAGPARAALILEKADPKTAVTFISFACTGASIKQGLLGVQNRKGHAVQPQLERVFAAVKRGTIDALIVSIGGNDLQFAKLVQKTILLRHAETDAQTAGILNKGLQNLPGDLGLVAERLRAPNQAAISAVFISEYPDIVRDETRDLCDHSVKLLDPLRQISEAESRWALNDVIIPLNGVIRERATNFGWNYVGRIMTEFGGDSESGIAHGFCADDKRWVNTFGDSRRFQGDTRGTVHPNREGHLWYARRLVEELKPRL